MFGNESKPSRIYAFGAKRPTQNLDLVEAQMKLGHQYRNKLVEIERNRRDGVQRNLQEVAPRVAELTGQLERANETVDAILKTMKTANSNARSKVATAADRLALKEAKETRRLIARELKEVRKASFADPVVKRAIESPKLEAARSIRGARGESGCHWGTYLRVEQGMQSARKGPPPKFRRWEGKGVVAVQIQKGMPWSELLAGLDRRARVIIRAPSPTADQDSRRSRENPMADLWMRVGSDGLKPIWAVIPFRMPRQVDPECRVKWISLHKRIVGTHENWEIQFILSKDSWEKDDNAVDGVAGIDVNWRVMSQGLRVATLVGDDGRETNLFLPRDLTEGWAKAESLQSIRDRNFDVARGRLVSWFFNRAEVASFWCTSPKCDPEKDGQGYSVPDEIRERFAFLKQWKSHDRLGYAIRWWADHRFPGDAGIYAEMVAWRTQDRHLHDWQDSQREKSIRTRNELYRRFAAIVRRHYKTVKIEDVDWKEIARRPGPDEVSDAAMKAYARVASVGKLIEYLKEAATETIEEPARNTTKRCHVCGSIEEFDHGKELIHKCSRCSIVWDQDRNAAINILRGPETIGAFDARDDRVA